MCLFFSINKLIEDEIAVNDTILKCKKCSDYMADCIKCDTTIHCQ